MISNRDMQTLAKVAAMFDGAADKIKAWDKSEAKAQLAAIEKAAGGKTKLDKADKILKAAEAKADRIVADAGKAAQGMRDQVMQIDASRRAQFDRDMERLAALKAEVEDRGKRLNEKEAAIAKDAADAKASWKHLAETRREVEARAIAVADREAAVASREARVSRIEEAADSLAASLA